MQNGLINAVDAYFWRGTKGLASLSAYAEIEENARKLWSCRDVVQRHNEAFADDRMTVGETSAGIFDEAKPPHAAFRSLRMIWPWMRHRLRHPRRARLSWHSAA
jgi:hypothetical protein